MSSRRQKKCMTPVEVLEELFRNEGADIEIEESEYEYPPDESDDDFDDEEDDDEPAPTSPPKPGPSQIRSKSKAKRELSAVPSTESDPEPRPKMTTRASSGIHSAQAGDPFTPSTSSQEVSPHRGAEDEEDEQEDEEYLPPSKQRFGLQSSKQHSAPSDTQSVSNPSLQEATVRPRKATSKSKASRRKTAPAVTEPAPRDCWKTQDEEDTPPNQFRFVPARQPGPVLDQTASWSVLQLFQLFFSSATVNKIIENTNLNAEKQNQTGKKYRWALLTVKEFYIFLGIILYTGLVSVRRRPDYWKKDFPYNHPFPRNKMTRDRFEAIMWSLHISNPQEDEENERKRTTAEYDRLFKIKPLYTELATACQSFFHPYRNICIDERMVASKARIGLKQYMKDKPSKWGYKLFVLADSSCGYTWNFFVYTGKNTTPSEHGLSYSSVMDLMPFSLLGSGYTLYVDNFYTSPALFRDLSIQKIGACGTIRKTRSGFPKTTENDFTTKKARGEIRWIREGQLVFVKWMDKREVTMLSSVHGVYSGKTARRRVKEQGRWQTTHVPCPDAVLDYNKSMGGVDLSDALFKYYSVRQKTTKWYKTLFFHFFDIAVVNAHIIHKELFKLTKDGTKPMTQKRFREKLLEEMLQFAEDSEQTSDEPAKTCMPFYYGEDATARRRYCRRCFEAGDKRVKTPIYCRKCQVPLCFTSKNNCFAMWHDSK